MSGNLRGPLGIVDTMEMIRHVIVFDAADVGAESSFWAAILQGRVVDDDEYFHCVIDASGAWRLGVQYAANHVRATWPSGSQQQQLHLDLHVDDPRSAHDEVTALGAQLLQAAANLDAEEGHQVYADPAGHPFCIGWGHPSHTELASFLTRRFSDSDS